MKIIFTLFICAVSTSLFSQGIRGVITDENGDPLPFATIFVEGQGTGTASNQDGAYMLRLDPGIHQITFQFLGYNSISKKVSIQNTFQELNIRLKQESIVLETIRVTAEREDAAYTIMRKAIAKAKYHTQQIDSYSATSYIKGSGRIKDLPGLFRKQIEKGMKESGVDTATAFITESVNEIFYKRPNEFKENVISIRTIGDDNNTSPNAFINSSFYYPKINGAVSPLSPQAFGYYKFEYLGFFTDRDVTINKIKVIPRSRGDQVFEGVIYITDQLWSIHSLDLATYIWGIRFEIQSVYAPVQPKVWLPINQIYNITGSFFGFDFEYQYFANISDYDIILNPDLDFAPIIIDDVLEKEVAQQADTSFLNKELDETFEALQDGKNVSRKQLRKVLKEYEKQELKASRSDTLEKVVSIYNQDIDSLAYKRDSTYWDAIRPIPLTRYEVKGYRVMDSIELAESEAESEDSLTISLGTENSISKPPSSNFHWYDLFFGSTYKWGDNLRFGLQSLVFNTHFNTVSGLNLSLLPYLYNRSPVVQWRLDPYLRYSFARNRFHPGLAIRLSWGKRVAKKLTLSGGRDFVQINEEKPIDPFINDLATLLFERNHMKVLDKDFLTLAWEIRKSNHLQLTVGASYFQKTQLSNASDFVLFGSKDRVYTSNAPFNNEIGETNFGQYTGVTFDIGLSMSPWQRYRISNGRKSAIEGSSPTVTFLYKMGIPEVLESDLDFIQLEAGIKHQFDVGIRGRMQLQILGGTFLGDASIPFPVFKHFPGNLTALTTTDPVKSYRLLDYYVNSTSSAYLEAHIHYQFRKFLITQFPLIRLSGIRENLFLNVLETKHSNHYFEAGFGINYIFRVFRLEFVSSFEDFKYKDFGIRIGLATNLENLFD